MPPRHPDGLKVIFYDTRAKAEAGASFLPLSGICLPKQLFCEQREKKVQRILYVVGVVLDLWCKH